MSEIVSTLHSTPHYMFGSPRYNCLRNPETVIVAEDYRAHDATNGTADKYFPCYTLTACPIPVTEFVDNTGQTRKHTGSFAFRQHKLNESYNIVGRKDAPQEPYNSTLERHKIYTTTYLAAKLNPGWCVIQTQTKPPSVPGEKQSYTPQYVVRALGNNATIRQLYAISLDGDANTGAKATSTSFLPGEIVVYKNNVFKCVQETKNYPPDRARDTDTWKYVNFERNVFNVDLFVLTDSTAAYFTDISDDTRQFDPITDDDDTLMCWGLAYYHNN